MIIGTVPYYNCLPLISGLRQPRVILPPRQLTQALLRDEIDVGLIPTYGIHKHALYAYPEAGLIGCNGTVKSVGIFVKNSLNLANISSIYFDGESQTSVALGKIILKELFSRNLRSITTVPLDRCHEADAQLLIGDKALFFKEPGYTYYDLGEHWKELTGLGFIFACWAAKRPLDPLEIEPLKVAKKFDFSSENSLLSALSKHKRETVLSYLKNNIIYDATPELLKGFEMFRAAVTDLETAETARLTPRDDTTKFYASFEI